MYVYNENTECCLTIYWFYSIGLKKRFSLAIRPNVHCTSKCGTKWWITFNRRTIRLDNLKSVIRIVAMAMEIDFSWASCYSYQKLVYYICWSVVTLFSDKIISYPFMRFFFICSNILIQTYLQHAKQIFVRRDFR